MDDAGLTVSAAGQARTAAPKKGGKAERGKSGGVDERHPIESIFHRAVEKAEEDGDLTVYELLEVFGARSLGPLLMVFGLIASTPPIGMIPLIPTSMGIMTFLVSVQFAAGRHRMWVPRAIGERSIGEDRLKAGQSKARGVARRIDRMVKRRLTFMTEEVALRLIALAACVLAIGMPPLELVPFGVAVPGVALVCLGIGVVARDGFFLIGGLAIGSATIALIALAVPWGTISGWFS